MFDRRKHVAAGRIDMLLSIQDEKNCVVYVVGKQNRENLF